MIFIFVHTFQKLGSIIVQPVYHFIFVLLVDRGASESVAILQVEDVFPLKFESVAKRWFGTVPTNHVGVAQLKQNGDYVIVAKLI